MKTFTKTVLATCVTLFTAAAMAAPVSLGSVDHLYGTQNGGQLPTISSIYHEGGNCDSATANGITVKATKSSTCNRFADVFDFSGINYDTIDYFQLTLDFTGARNQGLFSSERWNVRGASNYTQSANQFGAQLNAGGTQTFVFDNSKGLFDDILSAENFVLMFSTNSGASSNFNLKSAKLELFGTEAVAQVPEPGSLALLGLSLVALVGARRVRKSKAPKAV